MFNHLPRIICIILLLCLAITGKARVSAPKNAYRDSVLNRIYAYATQRDTAVHAPKSSYSYTKFKLRTNKRNATLMLVPSMYAVAHGVGREFFGEYYNKVTIDEQEKPDFHRILYVSTVPHRESPMLSSVFRYMVPTVYDENLYQNNILSPFHPSNRRFYTYRVTPLPYDMAQVYAYPRLKNTQVVETKAIVNAKTGKIVMVDFEGEYDMMRFYISLVMGRGDDYRARVPQRCDLKVNFRFLGSKITGSYTTIYHLPKVLSDTLDNVADTTLMAQVRPIKLNKDEKQIYDKFFELRHRRDSVSASKPKKKDFVNDFLWNVIGDNMVNYIGQDFGKQKQGNLRLSPILNPLYMSYSGRKGVVYKLELRGNYTFNDDVTLSMGIRGAYSFKQRWLYYTVPAYLKYSQKHNGWLQFEFGNGNRIRTNMVARKILGISEKRDSLLWSPGDDYTEFKDNYLRITNHWSFNSHWGFEAGLVAHHRQALFPKFYEDNGYPSSYRSVAPNVALEWQPKGKEGPFFKIDYERSFKKFLNSNIDYERVEMDMQNIFRISRRRLISLRVGAGFYTQKGDHWDFIDYTNFRDNNLPGGWNDEWSGDFELLNAEWYNASDYYFRTNHSYEAPMLLLAWAPLLGRFVEKERLYVNTLLVRRLHPYTEWGYSIQTRLISLGFFAAFQNEKYYGAGCKFSFELFRHW